MNFFSDNSEWKWMFENAVDWETILPLYYPKYPTEDGYQNKEEVLQFFQEMLTTTGEWAGSHLANEYAEKLDRDGIGIVKDGKTFVGDTMKEIYRQAAELGIFGLSLPTEYGGMGIPSTIHLILMAQGARACVATSTQMAFFSSIADMLNRYGDKEDKDRLIPKIISGEISGSMCLTEPGCGSDLSMIKTTATPQDNGTFLLNGTKCFITNGGGGIGLVLAKIKGAPEGLKGISMFLVEQQLEGKEGLNFHVTKNEEKMGMHGSFTTEVVYNDTVAKLIGEENKGLKMMLHLMNEARLAVALQSLGIIEAALSYANQYAQERQAFGKPIAELPLMKRNLSDFQTECDALRAMLVDTCSYFDIFTHLDLKKRHTNDLTKEEKVLFKDAKKWVRKRTPLVKYYATELATNLTIKAIQVLGGYGYMKDYPVERYHRDSFGPLLYEGTSQIQALMALKDQIKYAMDDPKSFFTNIFDKHPGKELFGGEKWSKAYNKAHYRFKKKMFGLFVKCLKPADPLNFLKAKAWTEMENINKVMEHAETLCQALSYLETLRVLEKQTCSDQTRESLFWRYHTLVIPKLEAIYTDWAMR